MKSLKTRSTRLTDLRLADRLREDDLRVAESRRLNDIRRITRKADHQALKAERLRVDAIALAESRRVDANRAGDVSAVALASSRAEMTATNLQEKATDSATALAAQVEAVAKVAAAAVEATTHSLVARIEPLEQLRYTQGGAKTQQQESRVQSNWTIERVMVVIGFVLGALYFILQSTP